MNWYKKAQYKEPPEWDFPEAEHDYNPNWDYERDEEPDEFLIKIVDDIVSNVNNKLMSEIGMGKAKAAYIKEDNNILAKYIYGTAPYPVFVINLEGIKESSIIYNMNIGAAIETTIIHELAHAIQDWMNIEMDEEEAEEFARHYNYFREIYNFWE